MNLFRGTLPSPIDSRNLMYDTFMKLQWLDNIPDLELVHEAIISPPFDNE